MHSQAPGFRSRIIKAFGVFDGDSDGFIKPREFSALAVRKIGLSLRDARGLLAARGLGSMSHISLAQFLDIFVQVEALNPKPHD